MTKLIGLEKTPAMTLYIDQNAKTGNSARAEVKKKINERAKRYNDYVKTQDNPNLLFLKSIIYTEELIKEIIRDIYGNNIKTEAMTLGRAMEYIKVFNDDEFVKKSIDLLTIIKKTRDKMAHELEFDINECVSFWNTVSNHSSGQKTSTNSNNLSNKQRCVAINEYFSDVIHGFLYIKTGMEVIPDFIKHKNSSTQ